MNEKKEIENLATLLVLSVICSTLFIFVGMNQEDKIREYEERIDGVENLALFYFEQYVVCSKELHTVQGDDYCLYNGVFETECDFSVADDVVETDDDCMWKDNVSDCFEEPYTYDVYYNGTLVDDLCLTRDLTDDCFG